ncbi:hypothetical protein BDV29DRAFT_173449 [Aspergillus leporis]|uniref:Uncharacterized protein n=1 Tax=Aspergillus leporis TaxID=41062 RepID=A0A5N5X5E4_9EURO|nr:hypothetical protein BDV29DRAFT_173449 [Aspergillus leporis]
MPRLFNLNLNLKFNMKFRSSSSSPSRGHLSARYVSTLCLFVTGIYGQLIGQPNVLDIGNSFCVGVCEPHLRDLQCHTPALPTFRSGKGCYACCFMDDHAGGFADKLGEEGPKEKEEEDDV